MPKNKERASRHEPGHVVAALACGIPVIDAWTSETRENDRYGNVDIDLAQYLNSPFPSREGKYARLALEKAAGSAAEILLHNTPNTTGLHNDFQQVAMALLELGVLLPGETANAKLLGIVVEEAGKLMIPHKSELMQLQATLLATPDRQRVTTFPAVPFSRTDAQDQDFVGRLRAEAHTARQHPSRG